MAFLVKTNMIAFPIRESFLFRNINSLECLFRTSRHNVLYQEGKDNVSVLFKVMQVTIYSTKETKCKSLYTDKSVNYRNTRKTKEPEWVKKRGEERGILLSSFASFFVFS